MKIHFHKICFIMACSGIIFASPALLQSEAGATEMTSAEEVSPATGTGQADANGENDVMTSETAIQAPDQAADQPTSATSQAMTGAMTDVQISGAAYAATDSTTLKQHLFQNIPMISARIKPDGMLGPELHLVLAMPETLVGDHAAAVEYTIPLNKNGRLLSSFSAYGPTVSAFCTHVKSDVSCQVSYALSYLHSVDFDQAETIAATNFAGQPAVLRDAKSAIHSFRNDPEGILRFRIIL